MLRVRGLICFSLSSILLITLQPIGLWAQSGTRLPMSGGRTHYGANGAGAAVSRSNGIAVVELFTSQGCSSCPPADAILKQIAETASKSKLPVHVLSFHVDYWNKLGWTDPYSDALFTRRQREYATALKLEQVYTPQMIVNGRTEFVGSHKSKAHQAITRSLARRATAVVELTLTRDLTKRQVALDYELRGAIEGKMLNVALVQTPEANAVPRGENAGRRLAHINVVRAFRFLPIQQMNGSLKLDVPEDMDLEGSQVIAYVQDPKSLNVVAATAAM